VAAPRQDHSLRRPVQLSADPTVTGMAGGEAYFTTGVGKEMRAFDGTDWQPQGPDVPFGPFVYEGPLAVHTGTKRFYWGGAGTHRLCNIRGFLEVPGSATVRVDINKNGTTIHTTQSNRLSLSSANSGIDSVAIGSIEVNKFIAGDYFTFDIDADGTTPAQGLVVILYFRRSGP
jgi:hypothetical protein